MSEDRLPEYDLNPHPCASCPYRRDAPPGLWAKHEYEKLRAFDTNDVVATFLCHQTNVTGRDTICRGWLTVASESISVRLLGMRGIVTWDEIYRDPAVPLYGSGNEAADAGEAGIARPSQRARRMIGRLVKKGNFRFDGDPPRRKRKAAR